MTDEVLPPPARRRDRVRPSRRAPGSFDPIELSGVLRNALIRAARNQPLLKRPLERLLELGLIERIGQGKSKPTAAGRLALKQAKARKK